MGRFKRTVHNNVPCVGFSWRHADTHIIEPYIKCCVPEYMKTPCRVQEATVRNRRTPILTSVSLNKPHCGRCNAARKANADGKDRKTPRHQADCLEGTELGGTARRCS